MQVRLRYQVRLSHQDRAYHLRLTSQFYPNVTARVQQAIGEVIPTIATGSP